MRFQEAVSFRGSAVLITAGFSIEVSLVLPNYVIMGFIEFLERGL